MSPSPPIFRSSRKKARHQRPPWSTTQVPSDTAVLDLHRAAALEGRLILGCWDVAEIFRPGELVTKETY